MIDTRVKETDAEGGVTCVFTMRGAKDAERHFKDMRSATVFAAFIAAQDKIIAPTRLWPWLRERGYDPAQLPAPEEEELPAPEEE